MMDYFHLNASRDQIAGISNLGLAHLGDAVFEVMVRSWLCLHGKASARACTRPPCAMWRPPPRLRPWSVSSPF